MNCCCSVTFLSSTKGAGDGAVPHLSAANPQIDVSQSEDQCPFGDGKSIQRRGEKHCRTK